MIFATLESTPVDLVTHRSGLPRHDLAWYLSDLSREELYQKLQFFPPLRIVSDLNGSIKNLMYMDCWYFDRKSKWSKLGKTLQSLVSWNL